MTVGLGIGSPQKLAASCTPEMHADLCKYYVHTALSERNVDQIVIPFTRNEHNRRPAAQNLNGRIEANFVIKNCGRYLGNDFVKFFSVLLMEFRFQNFSGSVNNKKIVTFAILKSMSATYC